MARSTSWAPPESGLIVGAHISLGTNPRAAVEKAAADGLRSMQIFASSPGAWKPPVKDPTLLLDFARARAEHGIGPLFIHSIYLINLASADPELVHKSKSSLVATLKAGAEMGATGVVTHIGSHAGRGFEAVKELVAAGLREILMRVPEPIDLILENSAGAGGIIGSRLEELGELIRLAHRSPRLKIGLDTAHLIGSGWDFGREETAEELIETVQREVGVERLAVIHANDSAQPVGSRKDRHANIGEGYVGAAGFARLLAQPPLRRVPWILETPNPERRVDDVIALRRAAGEEIENDT